MASPFSALAASAAESGDMEVEFSRLALALQPSAAAAASNGMDLEHAALAASSAVQHPPRRRLVVHTDADAKVAAAACASWASHTKRSKSPTRPDAKQDLNGRDDLRKGDRRRYSDDDAPFDSNNQSEASSTATSPVSGGRRLS